MRTDIKCFMADNKDNPSYQIYKSYIKRIHKPEEINIQSANLKEEIIKSLSLSEQCGLRTTSYLMSTLKAFLLWSAEDDEQLKQKVTNVFDGIDRRDILKLAKKNGAFKTVFITNREYREALRNIEQKVEYNSEYLSALFQAIYEGIYCNDMSVIRNLRYSDINGNVVTLHSDEDGQWDIEISDELKERLFRSSIIQKYSRQGRFGETKHTLVGDHYDSCFKIARRIGDKNLSRSTRQSYIDLIKRLCVQIDINVTPKNLFISGMISRIKEGLHSNGYTIEEAFSFYQRDKEIAKIIITELHKYNYDISVGKFMETVTGHADMFE